MIKNCLCWPIPQRGHLCDRISRDHVFQSKDILIGPPDQACLIVSHVIVQNLLNIYHEILWKPSCW